MTDRRQDAYSVRVEAAELARSRTHKPHKANGDEQRYAGTKYFMSFTKGLPHNPDTGLLEDPQDFVAFRRAIDDGFIDPFTERVRHGARYKVNEITGKTEDVLRPNAADEAAEQAQKNEKDESKKDAAAKEARKKAQQDVKNANDFRQWEAPTAGVVFDLEGPDAQAVTMPPAPPLVKASGQVNPELAFELAEVYELAVLRDIPLNHLEAGQSNDTVTKSLDRLNRLAYIQDYEEVCCKQFGRPRKLETVTLDATDDKLPNRQVQRLTAQTVFRGSSPGVEVGPYLSQFLLIGNTDINDGGGSVAEGKITYGVLQIDQRVPIATPKRDYMIDKDSYISVQRGLKQSVEAYEPDSANPACQGISPRPARRFISTPRDLATYVHYDALYEAYLNAGLILLGMQTPFDPGFDHLSGGGAAAGNSTTRRNASGFALYGGPHILTLVTEVATRALKAVRFQKFNNHIRLRPEALAARLELVRHGSEFKGKAPEALAQDVKQLEALLSETLTSVRDLEGESPQDGGPIPVNGTHFLPMAFPEGSPMHPAYGAGHATVAGACVTILKAFFDTGTVLATNPQPDSPDTPLPAGTSARFKRWEAGDKPIAYRAPKDGTTEILDNSVPPVPQDPTKFLTLEGELNKLAANISIGRDMAGVHFFSDYYDSLRMGEEIAIGMLEEQALTYSTDPFVLSVPTFDGDVIRIGNR